MLTLEEAKSLTYRQVIYHDTLRNADGTPQRWRVNGKVKTWKRSPERVEVPLKRGLKEYWYLTESNLTEFSLTEEVAANYGDDREDFSINSISNMFKF